MAAAGTAALGVLALLRHRRRRAHVRERRRDRRKARQRARAHRAEANAAGVIVRGLRYERPFYITKPRPAVHVDRPVAAGPIPIVHRDDALGLIVINKTAPMPSQKCADYRRNNLRSRLKAQLRIGGRLSVVHRLDICTTGVLILATTKKADTLYKQLIARREVRKLYVARVVGRWSLGAGACAMADDARPRTAATVAAAVRAAAARGAFDAACSAPVDRKPAHTSFCCVCHLPGDPGRRVPATSLVLCRPRTGRTHQIRIHLQLLGHPIANDPEHSAEVCEAFSKSMPDPYADDDAGSLEGMFASSSSVGPPKKKGGAGVGAEVGGRDEMAAHRMAAADPKARGPWHTGGRVWTRGIWLHAWRYDPDPKPGGGDGTAASPRHGFEAPLPTWAWGR